MVFGTDVKERRNSAFGTDAEESQNPVFGTDEIPKMSHLEMSEMNPRRIQDLQTIQAFIQKYEATGAGSISAPDLAEVLRTEDFSPIFAYAHALTRKQFGDVVRIRAILEFSNHCRRSCRYCGLNRTNPGVQRYRMEVDEIVDVSVAAYDAGYQTIVLQSGEDPYYTIEMLCAIIRRIKAQRDIAITMSCGERELSDYGEMVRAGADRYLLKHETADASIYAELHPCGTLVNRVRCLREIKRVGLETGSGFMIGLPRQDEDVIARDLLLLKSLDCDMAGIGPFLPSPGTALADREAGSPEMTKRAVALARMLLPKANLPATTSLGVLSSGDKNSIFSCGANVIMRKVTPQKYEEHYSIYPNSIKVGDIRKERLDLEESIRALGKIPV